MKADHLEFYKEVYYKELERRNSLNTEIALQGTILVAVISGLFFMLTNLKSEYIWFHQLFSCLVALETVISLVVAFFLMRSYFDFMKGGRTFTYLPKMKDVDAYYQQVEKKEFNSFLQDAFISACDTHIDHNDHKSRLLTRSSTWMTYLIMGGAIITIVFLSNYLFDNPNLKTTGNNADQKSERADTTAARPTRPAATDTTRQSNRTKASASATRRTRGQDTLHKEVK